MQPFDLEKALAGDPVITRDGRKVTDIIKYHDLVIGMVDRNITPNIWPLDGISFVKENVPISLFMAPKEEIRYLNVYDDNNTAYPHPTIDDAKRLKVGTARSISKLTFRNGEIISIETVHKY